MKSAARAVALRRSPKPVLTEIYKAIIGSNIRWRGKSSAASVPSGSFKPQKGQKLTKQERRAVVESVVEKYRAENGGRFPFLSHVLKETGGSHYIVRLIFQELVYNHMHSPSNNIKEVQLGKPEKVTYPIYGVKEELSVPEQESTVIPTAHGILKGDASISNVQVNSEVHKTVVGTTLAEEKLQINKQDSSDGQESKAYSDNTHILQADVSLPVKSEVTVETTSSASGVIEGSEKNIRATECLQTAPDPSIDLTENQGITKPEELSSDQGESSAKATGIWGNLKSLADGIISFWRKK